MGLRVNEGRRAIREAWEDLRGAYEEFVSSSEEMAVLGNRITFRVGVLKARLTGSGDLSMRYAAVTEWRDGLIARSTLYTDVDKARAAAERLAESRG